MPTVHLQFHADPDEAVELAVSWARSYGLELALEQFFPSYRAVSAASEQSARAVRKLHSVDRVALCARTPRLDARRAFEFVEINEDCLYLTIGKVVNDGVRESVLSGGTDDGGVVKTWRKLVRDLKKAMHKGATVRSPATGASHPVPAHWHTARAHDLAERGVRMLDVSGTNEYMFDDLAS